MKIGPKSPVVPVAPVESAPIASAPVAPDPLDTFASGGDAQPLSHEARADGVSDAQQQHVHGAFAQMAALAQQSASVDEVFGGARVEVAVGDAQQQHVHDAFTRIGAHVAQHGGGLLGLVVGLES